jgi:Putative MetA-pathway of phenol degradation
MSRRTGPLALVAVGFLLVAASSASGASLSELLPGLFGQMGIILPTAAGHEPHFTVSSEAQLTILNDSLRGQISNIPIPSPASSFIFQFDPAVGAFTRSTESLGPTFAQRPETIGRNRFSLGIAYSRFTFDQIDGKDLSNGELKLTFGHLDVGPPVCNPTCAFEADTITAKIFAQITSDVLVASATYGVLDNLDVSIGIPLIRNEIRLKGIATINHVGTAPGTIHQFANGTDTLVAKASGESTGIGDILLRGKYNLYRDPLFGMATGLDVRLPTGDEDELRGVGTARVSPFFLASANIARVVSPHINVGVTLGDRSKIDNEFFYAVGVDWAVIKPLTLNFDVLGRRIIDNQRLEAGQGPGGRRIADSNIVDAALGFKLNPWKNAVFLFNVLVPLNNTGLRDHVTPVVGVEITF